MSPLYMLNILDTIFEYFSYLKNNKSKITENGDFGFELNNVATLSIACKLAGLI